MAPVFSHFRLALSFLFLFHTQSNPVCCDDLVQKNSQNHKDDFKMEIPQVDNQIVSEDKNQVGEVYKDENTILFFNNSINAQKTKWIFKLYSKAWGHAKKNYGPFKSRDGDGNGSRLTGKFHTDAPEGSLQHGVDAQNQGILFSISPSSLRQENLYDKSKKATQPKDRIIWDYNLMDISRVIEESNNGVYGSPAKDIWMREGFYPIMVYDVLSNIGNEYKEDAEEWKKRMSQQRSDAGTVKSPILWMKDWWLPLYEKHGKTKFLSQFFSLLARNWKQEENKNGPRKYVGQMNVGEFVHFVSGAAGTNLRSTADSVLGMDEEDDDNFIQAQKDYPSVTY